MHVKVNVSEDEVLSGQNVPDAHEVKVKVVEYDPLVFTDPAQLLVQEVTFVDVHVKLTADPGVKEIEVSVPFAFKSTVGEDGGLTVTLSVAVPPEPVQVIVYVWLDDGAVIDCEPFVLIDDVQPPEVEQDVALADIQVKETLEPDDIDNEVSVPFACKSTVGDDDPLLPPLVVGAIVTLSVAVPFAPVQVIVYVWLVDWAVALYVPLVLKLPDHAPEAVHEVTLLDVQVKETLDPDDIDNEVSVPFAFKSTVGVATDVHSEPLTTA